MGENFQIVKNTTATIFVYDLSVWRGIVYGGKLRESSVWKY